MSVVTMDEAQANVMYYLDTLSDAEWRYAYTYNLNVVRNGLPLDALPRHYASWASVSEERRAEIRHEIHDAMHKRRHMTMSEGRA